MERPMAKTFRCDSWKHFYDETKQFHKQTTVAFRGQSDHQASETEGGYWPVRSLYERAFVRDRELLKPYGHLQEGVNFLPEMRLDRHWTKFKQLNRQHHHYENILETQWLMIGRHYGLFTRLIDWTWDPRVALFFALEDFVRQALPGSDTGFTFHNPPVDFEAACAGHVSIWAYHDPSAASVLNEFQVITDTAPEPLGHRQAAQKGLFTYLNSSRYHDLESYIHSRGILDRLTRYVVPRKCAFTALRELQMEGFSYATMFPDPEGFAKEANLQEWGTKQ